MTQEAGSGMKDSPQGERNKIAGPVRKQIERVRGKFLDVESRIRQRMRIYPHKRRMLVSRTEWEREIDESELRLPPGGSGPSGEAEEQPRRSSIVSIHGRDIDIEKRESEGDDFEHPLAS